ncbi:hypothetical protein Tco_1374970 [Tanacetum coccineum]
MMKFLEIFQKIHFDISFADALLYMPKFAFMFKSLISNKEKLFELLSTPLNENCSAVLLKKLPDKLGDPGKTSRTLIDVYVEEITLRFNDEAPMFNLEQTSRYSSDHYAKSVNQIDIIDVACDEYSQEVLGFSDGFKSGNPTSTDPMIATSFPSLTPFEGGDFILEEIENCLSNGSIPPGIDDEDF